MERGSRDRHSSTDPLARQIAVFLVRPHWYNQPDTRQRASARTVENVMTATATPPKKPPIFNLPNQLTASRLVLGVILFVLIEHEQWLWCIGIFALAAFSDWLDGYIARKQGITSTLGRNLDPLVDKVVICGRLHLSLEARAIGSDAVDDRHRRVARADHHRLAFVPGKSGREFRRRMARQDQDGAAMRRSCSPFSWHFTTSMISCCSARTPLNSSIGSAP